MSSRPSHLRLIQKASSQNDLETQQCIASAVESSPSKIDLVRASVTSQSKFLTRSLQILSITSFLVSWVANGELLQGIANGSVGFDAYDRPVFLTWLSYNFMTLSFVVVCIYLQRRKWTLRHYACYVWAGKLGLSKAILACTLIGFTLQVLNVLFIVGLECLSVSLSNAVYQLQTVFTVGLSVCWLKDPFVATEAWGIIVSVVGIALIVMPPLLVGEENDVKKSELLLNSQSSSCPFTTAPQFMGVLTAIGSAAIGGGYLVSWRVLDQKRHATSLGRIEGLIDTQMTVSMIGLCNLLVGWPLWLIAQGSGLELSQVPSSTASVSHPPPWWLLTLNGLVEYSFDASCAVAIYMTSPVVVAIVSPLTIPLSLLVDSIIWTETSGRETSDALMSWFGVAVICFGVYLLETKPTSVSRWWHRCGQHEKKIEHEDDLEIDVVLLTSST